MNWFFQGLIQNEATKLLESRGIHCHAGLNFKLKPTIYSVKEDKDNFGIFVSKNELTECLASLSESEELQVLKVESDMVIGLANIMNLMKTMELRADLRREVVRKYNSLNNNKEETADSVNKLFDERAIIAQFLSVMPNANEHYLLTLFLCALFYIQSKRDYLQTERSLEYTIGKPKLSRSSSVYRSLRIFSVIQKGEIPSDEDITEELYDIMKDDVAHSVYSPLRKFDEYLKILEATGIPKVNENGLEGTTIYDNVIEKKQILDTLYEQILAMLKQGADWKEHGEIVSEWIDPAVVYRCDGIIRSRSLELIRHDVTENGTGEIALFTGLVPIIDFANHSNEKNIRNTYFKVNEDNSVGLYYNGPLDPAEFVVDDEGDVEILITYNPNVNPGAFYYNYGFIPFKLAQKNEDGIEKFLDGNLSLEVRFYYEQLSTEELERFGINSEVLALVGINKETVKLTVDTSDSSSKGNFFVDDKKLTPFIPKELLEITSVEEGIVVCCKGEIIEEIEEVHPMLEEEKEEMTARYSQFARHILDKYYEANCVSHSCNTNDIHSSNGENLFQLEKFLLQRRPT